MPSFRVKNLAISIDKAGAGDYAKATYPIRFGKYSEIRTPDYEFHLNQKGEIRFIRGLGVGWRHPGELLKRTDGNDWVYYSLGSVGGRIKQILGEYYLPCLPYPSNSIWEFNPFNDVNIMQALGAWAQTWATLVELPPAELPGPLARFRDLLAAKHDNALHQNALALRAIGGERISVLPPDTRQVDYEVIPLMVADGCRYHCGFCCVKSPSAFRPRPWEDIQDQLRQLKAFYGPNLSSYKGLFLGNHDALGAGEDLLINATAEAMEVLGLEDPRLFLFGSVGSLLACGESFFARLSRLAGQVYINLGLESVDPATLAAIKKPLGVAQVRQAFGRMLALQFVKDYENTRGDR